MSAALGKPITYNPHIRPNIKDNVFLANQRFNSVKPGYSITSLPRI
jgi:hypothetical protein